MQITQSKLTLEQQATNYETLKHIQLVGKNIHTVVRELLTRAEHHDTSKLESPEVEAFTEYTPKLSGTTYGSVEYNQYKTEMQVALDHHYANNRHHPEHQRRDEEWRAVPDFEGHYEVSNYGSVRSLDRIIERSGPTGNMVRTGQILQQEITPKGYCRVQLRDGDRYKNFQVHRLVAMVFIPNPENKPEVNHIRGRQKTNNRITNLEWATSCENLQHAYDTGLKKALIKYVVHCEELDLVTFGCEKMAAELRKRGYEKANAASIWRVINHGGKHLDLEFTGNKFETWMDSGIADMDLVDLMEMFCDWAASCKRHHDGNLRKSCEINGKRFDMSPQLVRIFENTIHLFEE